MEKFAAYIAAFDGTADWPAIQPLFDAAFHPDLVVVTPDGEMSKGQWAEMAKGLADKGATASDLEVGEVEGDVALYKVTVTVDGEPMHMTSRGTISDGRMIRVEPLNPEKYQEMMARSK